MTAGSRPIISPAEVAALSPAPLLIDVRPAEEYAVSRIPGAVHLDLWGISLVDTSEAPLRAFMWMIGHLFSLRGVTPDRPVVVYETDSGLRAARAYWFLEYLGHPTSFILDGGVGAWLAAGKPLTTEVTAPVPSDWHGTPDPAKVATWQHVSASLSHRTATIVDTRSDGEYYGETVRAKRGGAIPGAVHLEWKQNLSGDGRYKAASELRAMYEHAGVGSTNEIVTYCQGGYRAAHSYVALKLAGFESLRNYTGSWKEWGDREDLPIEHPSRPGPTT